MLIKYTGAKESKKLQYFVKDWGLMDFTFNPTCKVTDPEFARFLLHPDRKGLFVIVDEPEAEQIPAEAKKPEPSYVPPAEQITKDLETRTEKKQRKAEEKKKAAPSKKAKAAAVQTESEIIQNPAAE